MRESNYFCVVFMYVFGIIVLVMFRLASSFIQFSVRIALSYGACEANSVRHLYTSVEKRASILNYCVDYIIHYSTIFVSLVIDSKKKID